MLATAGCSTSRCADRALPAAPSPAQAAATGAPTTVPARPASPQPTPGGLDATTVCVQFARAAGTVDTTTSDLGQARQAAARAFGTPTLQALFSGAGQGRNREQETWQQHRARVTATAVPLVDDDHEHDHDQDHGHDHHEPGAGQRRAGTPVAVTVTGTARGTGGWRAATESYRLDCLSVQDPVAGWLVDDIAVTVLPPAPAAG